MILTNDTGARQGEGGNTAHGGKTTEREVFGRQSRRYRRRPALICLGLALLAASTASSVYLTQLSGDTVPVLAVARDVARGQIIDDADLTVAHAVSDPALAPVPVTERNQTVGLRAAADLTAGTLLTSAAVTSGDLPAAGETIVGVALTEAQMPAEKMIPGDNVRIFETPNLGDRPPKNPPASISARVISVSEPTQGTQTIVDVVVDADTAGALAARVATGRIALVLDSAEHEKENAR